METNVTFEALPLAAPLQRALREKNYTQPSPIQAQAIPHLLEGVDLLGVAQTGTGKTAAFCLPILHTLDANPRRPRPHTFRCLVLAPTRELAEQVSQSFIAYGQHLRHLSVTQVYGGVGFGNQIKALRRGVDVLVACPGRLLDLHQQGYVDFSQVEHFVLDEADRMLDMGFIHDMRKIAAELPDERQTLLFSATMTPDITRLANTLLHEPVEVRVASKETTAERCEHRMCYLQAEDKLDLLEQLIREHLGTEEGQLALVFSRTKFGADRLAKAIQRACDVRVEAIHGNKTQNARQRALENFRSGRAQVLVATDVAARGIDVKNITLVINFDLPNEPEAYVHRIGRTARAGAEGLALSFCTPNDRSELAGIERLLRAEIPSFDEHPYHQQGLADSIRRRHRGPSGNRSKGPRGGGFRGRGGPRGNAKRRGPASTH